MSGKKAKEQRRELNASIATGDSPQYWDYVDDLIWRIHVNHLERARCWTMRNAHPNCRPEAILEMIGALARFCR